MTCCGLHSQFDPEIQNPVSWLSSQGSTARLRSPKSDNELFGFVEGAILECPCRLLEAPIQASKPKMKD